MKKLIYWLTILPPLIDIIKGALSGLEKGLADIKDEKMTADFERVNNAGNDGTSSRSQRN